MEPTWTLLSSLEALPLPQDTPRASADVPKATPKPPQSFPNPSKSFPKPPQSFPKPPQSLHRAPTLADSSAQVMVRIFWRRRLCWRTIEVESEEVPAFGIVEAAAERDDVLA